MDRCFEVNNPRVEHMEWDRVVNYVKNMKGHFDLVRGEAYINNKDCGPVTIRGSVALMWMIITWDDASIHEIKFQIRHESIVYTCDEERLIIDFDCSFPEIISVKILDKQNYDYVVAFLRYANWMFKYNQWSYSWLDTKLRKEDVWQYFTMPMNMDSYIPTMNYDQYEWICVREYDGEVYADIDNEMRVYYAYGEDLSRPATYRELLDSPEKVYLIVTEVFDTEPECCFSVPVDELGVLKIVDDYKKRPLKEGWNSNQQEQVTYNLILYNKTKEDKYAEFSMYEDVEKNDKKAMYLIIRELLAMSLGKNDNSIEYSSPQTSLVSTKTSNVVTRPGVSLMEREKRIIILIDNSIDVETNVLGSFNQSNKHLIQRIKETANNDNIYIQILSVNEETAWEQGPIKINNYESKEIKKGLNACVSKALQLLNDELRQYDKDYHKYIRPTIIFFSGSYPIDDYRESLKELLENELFAKSNRIAISIGKTDKRLLDAFSDNHVIFAQNVFDIVLDEIWDPSCAVPSILFSNTDNKKRLVEVELDIHCNGIFRVVDSDSIEEKVSIEPLSEILNIYPDIWKDDRRMKAILMDYYAKDKLRRNLIYACLMEHIPHDMVDISCINQNDSYRFAKKLSDAYGCDLSIAEEIISIWIDALKLETIIEISVDSSIEKEFIDEW